jgi:hypothetical protein
VITKRILHALAFTPISGNRWGLPCLFWGPPGVGKTAIIEEFGRGIDLPVETLSPGERGEGAFGVTPVPDGEHLRYPAPDWTERVKDGGLVFVDEITLAEPALQKYIMALIHARRIGSAQLGPRVRVIAAANAVEEAAGGWDLALPLANRMLHLDWEPPTAEDWSDWLLGGAGETHTFTATAILEEARTLAAWPIAFAKASGVISGFVRRRPDLLHKMPKPGDPAGSRAWPSHRSWEMATRVTASSEIHNLSREERETLLKGSVGHGAAMEMIEFLDSADLPDPTDVLDGIIPFEHDPRRLDRTAAILTSCAALAACQSNGNRLRHAAKLWSLIGTTMNGAEDVAIPAARVLCRAGFIMLPEAQPTLTRIGPFLKAAGIKHDQPITMHA